MQPKGEENNCMSEKILTDIQHIIYSDTDLIEFCIVPTNENKNKSPVLYEEHNLGLESWCVKYVYSYLYAQLFDVRKLLRRNQLPWSKGDKLDKLLIGALLINPGVQTFWNMRRELVDYGEIRIDKELQFTRLVLSNKSKSNEAFAYRRWILNKLLKSVSLEEHFGLLNNEFVVCEKTAQRAQNNYHSWTHRAWCLQNIPLSSTDYLDVVLAQLDWSESWIVQHVSEHCGYHYRQYLFSCILNNKNINGSSLRTYYDCAMIQLKLPVDNDDALYLKNLFGHGECYASYLRDKLKSRNYACYVSVLLYDLLHYITNLNSMFADHESLWYHRRFIIYNLFRIAYDYHQITWNRNPRLDKSCSGQKYSKLVKYDLNVVESSYLYNLIVENERKIIEKNCSSKCSESQVELAQRHKKWLQSILGINSF